MIRFLVLLLIPLSLWAGPKSGYEYLTPESRAIQDDDFQNPGMSAVEEGSKLFHAHGEEGHSCATCHGEGGAKLDPRRIAAYPVFGKAQGKPVTLRDRVHICWEERLGNFPLEFDDKNALYLETFVRHLARGEPVNVDVSAELKPFYEMGEKLYRTRLGQFGMTCYHCHDQYPGRKMRAQPLSEGQTNGFPTYRLGSGKVTSLGDRLNECMVSLRAARFEHDSEDYRNLEVYLNARGNGLKIETPAVRY